MRTREPVLIVGAPRSGTSLVREVLRRDPDLEIGPETHLLDVWARRFPGLLTDLGDGFERFWRTFTRSRDFRWYELDPDQVRRAVLDHDRVDGRAVVEGLAGTWAWQRGAIRWGEKTPTHFHHLDTLLAWWPGARVVFVVRDPRDVVASRLAVRASWATDDVEAIARDWSASAVAADRWEDDERVLIVRYEELVGDPEAVVRDVCAHVGLSWRPDLLDPSRTREEGFRHGRHDPRGRIATGSLGRWRHDLRAAQVAVVETTSEVEMRRWGYEPSGDGLGIAGAVEIARNRTGRLVRRAINRLRSPSADRL